MTSKRLRLAVVACMLALTLSAGAQAKTKLVFATYASGAGTPAIWSSLIEQFTAANPDIEVDVQVYTFAEYVDKIVLMAAGGTAPDVFQTWAQNKPQWVSMGLIKDVTHEWENSAVLQNTQFYPFMLDSALYNGRYYGIPYDFNAVVWFHNLDWMQERGVPEPDAEWTVDDFMTIARKLVDPERQVYATHNRNNAATALSLQWTYNWTGHEWLSEDRSQVLLEDPAVTEMLSYWLSLQNDLHAIPYPGGFSPRPFVQGGYAITEEYMSLAFSLDQQATFDWGVSLLPKAPAAQYSHAQAHLFSVANDSKEPEAAWRLLEWLASYDGQKAILATTQRQPLGPYMDLWEEFFGRLSPHKASTFQQWVASTLYGQNYIRNFEYWETYPTMQPVMNEHLRNIFTNGRPIANEMTVAAQRLRAILGSK